MDTDGVMWIRGVDVGIGGGQGELGGLGQLVVGDDSLSLVTKIYTSVFHKEGGDMGFRKL